MRGEKHTFVQANVQRYGCTKVVQRYIELAVKWGKCTFVHCTKVVQRVGIIYLCTRYIYTGVYKGIEEMLKIY